METFKEAVPLYLKACEVEGKTERTVQSYAETLRHFSRAVGELQLPNSVGSLRAGTCLPVHGLGPRPRRKRRYSAPETARGQGLLFLVPPHGLLRGEPLHAGADGEAGAEGHPALLRKRTSPCSSGPAIR